MQTRFITRCVAAGLGSLLSVGAAQAVILYDPTLGTLPSAQGWFASGEGPAFSESVVNSAAYLLDTTADAATKAGFARFGQTGLNTVTGFKLEFTLRVIAESHVANPNRAGFSVIMTGTGDASHALELSFWDDEVWAATSGFTHGTHAAYDTTNPRLYSLAVQNNSYTLYGGGQFLFSGALIDFPANANPVYNLPGFLFFGDDTTSAKASVELGEISISAVPEPASGALLLAGLAALGWRRRSAAR